MRRQKCMKTCHSQLINSISNAKLQFQLVSSFKDKKIWRNSTGERALSREITLFTTDCDRAAVTKNKAIIKYTTEYAEEKNGG